LRLIPYLPKNMPSKYLGSEAQASVEVEMDARLG
jgi:hypothetical protein